MRDLPFFTTQSGVASLTLREIPYTQKAYVKFQSASDPDGLLLECKDFCRAVGAVHIYISGHPICERYPLHTAIWQMRCAKDVLADTDAALFPVTESTVHQWRGIYNEKACNIPNAAWMTEDDSRQMLCARDGYFVHRNGELLGIGRVDADSISWIASLKPGAGETVMCALAHAITGDTVTLEVASENRKAVAFYERLGFTRTKELSKWHCL